jgi:hypothetical protein
MAAFIGSIIGEAVILFVVFAIILAIGKIGALRNHSFAVHVTGVALVWLLATVVALSASAPPAAYVVTLAAIWSYRRDTKKTPSGWYRLGAGLTAAWCALWLLILSGSGASANSDGALVAAWVFAVLGLSIWLLGWLIQWIRAGFKGKAAA